MPSNKRKQAVKKIEQRQLPRWVRWLPVGTLTLVAVAALVWFEARLSDPATLPIRKVLVQGSFVHLNEAMLRDALGNQMHEGFFSVDVLQLRDRVTRLAWVDTASVRRVWPDTLVIRVVEQQPLARWQRGGLVNLRGEVFTADPATYPDRLPLFRGADSDSLAVTRWYHDVMPVCGSIERQVVQIEFSERGALRLKLDNGMEVMLGREHIQERLARFAEVYRQSLLARSGEIKRIDLRYTNGVAVRWKSDAPKQAG